MSEALPAGPVVKKASKGPRLSALPEAGCILCRLSFVVVGCGAKAFGKSVLESDMAKEMAASAGDGGGEKGADPSDIVLEEAVGKKASAASLVSKASSLVHADEEGLVVTLDFESQTMGRINIRTVEDFSDSIPQVKDAADVRNSCFFLLVDSRQDTSDVFPPLQRAVAEAKFNHAALVKAGPDEHTPALRSVIVAHELGAECAVSDPDASTKAFYDKVLEMSGDSGLTCLHYKVDFDNPEFVYACFEEVASQMYSNLAQRERSTVRSPHLPAKKSVDDNAGKKGCCALQ